MSLDLRPLRNTLPRLTPLLAVIAAITVFYSEALGTPLSVQAMLTDEDVASTFRPVLLEQFEYVHRFGDMPRWTDRRGFGQSQLLNPFYGTFYAPRLREIDEILGLALRLASRAEEAADWLVWGHSVIAALAAMALARHYRISPWAAALAGILFTLGHLPVRWAPLFHAPIHFATYPLSILGTELIWSGRSRLGVPLLALSLGASGTGTHLQNTHMVIQIVFVLAIYRLVTIDVPVRERQRRLLLSIAALALGIVIMAPALVPFVFEQDNAMETRQETIYEAVAGMNRDSLLTHIDPGAGGINDSVYMGPLMPVLVLVGIAVSVRHKRLAFLPLLLALALLAGFKTPLLEVLWHLVPGWSVLSNVQRVSFVTVLPVAMLAALGADWLADPQRRRGTVVAFAAAGTMSLVYWLLRSRELGQAPSFEFWQASIEVLIIAVVLHRAGTRRDRKSRGPSFPLVGLAFVLSFLTLWEGRTMGWRPVPDAPPPQYRDMLALVRAQNDRSGRWTSFALDYGQAKPNAFLEVPGRWLDTYESFVTKEFFTYWRMLTGATRYDHPTGLGGLWYQHLGDDPAPHPNLVNAAGISRILSSDSRVAEAHTLGWTILARRGNLLAYDNPNAFPLAYLSRRWESVPGDTTAAIARLAAVRDATFRSHTDYITGAVEVASPGGDPFQRR